MKIQIKIGTKINEKCRTFFNDTKYTPIPFSYIFQLYLLIYDNFLNLKF